MTACPKYEHPVTLDSEFTAEPVYTASVVLLWPVACNRSTLSAGGVMSYQTDLLSWGDVQAGSPASEVASVTSTVSLKGSDEMTVAFAKSSFEGGAALAVAGTNSAPATSAAIASPRNRRALMENLLSRVGGDLRLPLTPR
jgi:hypothetical protein